MGHAATPHPFACSWRKGGRQKPFNPRPGSHASPEGETDYPSAEALGSRLPYNFGAPSGAAQIKQKRGPTQRGYLRPATSRGTPAQTNASYDGRADWLGTA